ncbi:DEAD/DEAH box helicase [Clostridium perfringens]|uniref:SUV3 family DEAD/DEAH box RNA helicase n=1 Tax=Clostridium perfringens TaxID=1502 RepID=UPI002FE0A8D9
MKKNAAQREYKKLSGQINQIENIVRHSKAGALFEHESTLRKKILQLKEMKDQGLKGYESLYDRYEELLEEVGKRILENYNKKNDTNFDFYEVLRNNYNVFLNSGIMTLLVKHHIPELISKEFDEKFPANPKDEYIHTRRLKRKFYLHLGETNTGKTYTAMQRLKDFRKGVYLSPLRILALENFERLNNEGVKCNLLTGEEEILFEDATHVSCTIEKANIHERYDVAVIDEIQMIDDSQRGYAWTRALLGLYCTEIHICGAFNAKNILKEIIEDCGDDYEIIEYHRDIPLIVEDESFHPKNVQEGDALVLFSKKKVLQMAEQYSQMGIKCSIIYGDLPPEVRKKQYEEFITGKNKILITTDAIGMGVNLPIKRIIFLSISKFDGEQMRELTSQEVKQIAGRAGRKGIYDTGYVATYRDNKEFIEERLEEEDISIKRAVLGPSDAILEIDNLPLNEKLALWSTKKCEVPYYRKMDISEYLIILERLKSYKLLEEIQWELLKIPFDISKDDLMNQFLNFVDQLFINDQEELFKPQCYSGTLYDLETYYQMVNMYYSFSKRFNLNFDLEWIENERLTVSEEINNILMRI